MGEGWRSRARSRRYCEDAMSGTTTRHIASCEREWVREGERERGGERERNKQREICRGRIDGQYGECGRGGIARTRCWEPPPAISLPGLGFGVWGVKRCFFSGFEFRVLVPGSEFRVSGFGFRVSDFGFLVPGPEFRVQGVGWRDPLGSQLKNNNLTEMCSGSKAGS